MPQGLSLHIGLNTLDPVHYKGASPLNAAVNDALFWEEFAMLNGYSPRLLRDEEATAEDVVRIFRDYSTKLKAGDIMLVTYSGHGGSMPNKKPTALNNETNDQTWCLYNRQLLDDEIYECFESFVEGVRILVISDSCHSGTVTKDVVIDISQLLGDGMAASGKMRGFRSKKLSHNIEDYIESKFGKDVYEELQKKYETKPQGKGIKASVKLLAACQDEQVTFDGDNNGIFTNAFIQLFKNPAYRNANAEMLIAGVRGYYYFPQPNFFQYGSIIPSFDTSFPFTIDIPQPTVINGYRKPVIPQLPSTIREVTEDWDTMEEATPATLLVEIEGELASDVIGGKEAKILHSKTNGTVQQITVLLPNITSECSWSAAHAINTELIRFGYKSTVEPITTVIPAQRERISKEGDINNPDYIKEWPPSLLQGKVGIGWHLDDDHSQLKKANEHIRKNKPEAKVVVGHLDTGYIEDHVALPLNLRKDLARSFINDEVPNQAIDKLGKGQDGHGLGTMTLLAGNEVPLTATFNEFEGFIGGIPFADIVPMRIAETVVIFNSNNFCDAIDYAIEQKCEVISMSMAGKPSKRMAKAVNRAYENGTVLVTAASNCWYKGPGSLLPKCVLFPAAFERVIAATGAMYDHKPYDVNFLQASRFNIGTKYMQGSWGPASRMTKAIAGYTPNTPWASYRVPFLRSGGGTSSATPQIAATAALWIAFHRDELEAKGYYKEGQQWKKVEAARHALFSSAAKDNVFSEWEKYYGNGIMRAYDALMVPVADESILKKSPEAESSVFGILELVGSFFKRRKLFRSAEPKPSEEALAYELLHLLQTDSQFYELYSGLDLSDATAVLKLVESAEFRNKVLQSPYASDYLKETMAD